MNNKLQFGAGLLLLTLLAGCAEVGDDFRPSRPEHRPAPPMRVAYKPYQPPPPATDAPTDPFQAPDALSGGMDEKVGKTLPTDVLTGGDQTPQVGKDAGPFHDPLAEAPDGLAETHGPKMPTMHSHWLHGSVFNARVEVRLNNAPLGTFYAPVDRDITMRCRNGVNTISFTYTPTETTTASAHLDVLESEHTPAIGPLATFRSPPATPAVFHLPRPGEAPVSTSAQSVTDTMTFVAK